MPCGPVVEPSEGDQLAGVSLTGLIRSPVRVGQRLVVQPKRAGASSISESRTSVSRHCVVRYLRERWSEIAWKSREDQLALQSQFRSARGCMRGIRLEPGQIDAMLVQLRRVRAAAGDVDDGVAHLGLATSDNHRAAKPSTPNRRRPRCMGTSWEWRPVKMASFVWPASPRVTRLAIRRAVVWGARRPSRAAIERRVARSANGYHQRLSERGRKWDPDLLQALLQPTRHCQRTHLCPEAALGFVRWAISGTTRSAGFAMTTLIGASLVASRSQHWVSSADVRTATRHRT
jgi:hypothetical protein